MATYNGSPYLAAAIDSVLAQTYESFELIVVDDCSEDETALIVEDYAQRNPGRIHLVRKSIREGPCAARNDALAVSRGPLICWLDQDDLWMPAKLAEQVDVMAKRPDVGLVYTYFETFDSTTDAPIAAGDGQRDLEGDLLADLFRIGCFIASLTTMFRREALELRGGRLRDRDFSIGDDYYLWLTIALDWQIARIPRILARYRRHDVNESSRIAEASNVAAWRVALLREFLDEHPDARRRLGPARAPALAWHSLLAYQFERQHCRGLPAARQALRAVSYSPRTVLRTRLGRLDDGFR